MFDVVELDSLDIFDPSHGEVDVLPTGVLTTTKLLTTLVDDGVVISFDQALANTGWVLIDYRRPVPAIIAGGTIKTRPSDDRTSWDDTLERASIILDGVNELLDTYSVDLVLHEMPPVGSGPFVRASYASVVASVAVRGAAHQHGLRTEHVAARKVKKHLTGNAGAKKKEVQDAIEKRIANGELADESPVRIKYNEHIYDAIGIAITYREKS
jgi:Holliday junction resolvasome RuvABC endonuclease subunit